MVFEGKQMSQVPPTDFYSRLHLALSSNARCKVKGPNLPHSQKFQH